MSVKRKTYNAKFKAKLVWDTNVDLAFDKSTVVKEYKDEI